MAAKPSYASMVVRVLEANAGRSMTIRELEEAIAERWGTCSRTCLAKAIQKTKEGRKVVEHAESSYQLAPTVLQKALRRKRRASRPKRLTGYNLFVQERMRASADEAADSITARMARVAAEWRTQSATRKAEFDARAAELNASIPPATQEAAPDSDAA